MPKDTFFNLPMEKKQRIEYAAIQEFKNFTFDTSSINRIVENSDISKGSFYQYFEDKKDLYKHIMGIIVTKKLEYLTPTMMNPFDYDLFTLLREIYKSGLSFALENPDLLEIGNKLLSDSSHPIYTEVMMDNKSKSDEVFEMLLNNALKRGEIRQGLDLKMIAYLLTNLNILISDYYIKKSSVKEYTDEMAVVIDQFINFIQYGIANKGGEN